MKYYNAIKSIGKDFQVRPDPIDSPNVDWYYGPPGVGKSYKARQEFDATHADYYIKSANTKWWDGYNNQDFVVIDDVDTSHAYMGYHFKIWFDRYPFVAESKGGSRQIRPKKIIVTSNCHPNRIWPSDDNTLLPIMRRIRIINMEPSGNIPVIDGQRVDVVLPAFGGETKVETITGNSGASYAHNFNPPKVVIDLSEEVLNNLNGSIDFDNIFNDLV